MGIKNSSDYFYVCEGTMLKNKEDMLNLLKVIDDVHLAHHFNSEKNDFFKWTRDILKDKVLARKLENAKTREEMIEAIEKRLSTPSRVRKGIMSKIKDAVNNG